MANLNISSVYPPKMSSYHVSYDAASLYPGSYSGMSIVSKTYFLIDKFPFTIRHKDYMTNLETYPEIIKDISSIKSFDRRLKAEQYRMGALKEHYKKIGNMTEYKHWLDRYNNIEEEHPEWLI